MYDVIVIGGGASGLMAAGRAAQRGKRVLLLEKNDSLGEKLKITGGGRCNITNAEEDEHRLLSQYGAAKAWLHAAFAQFGVTDTFTFFTERGLPLVIQAAQRVFPATETASDVVRVLEKCLRTGGVEVRTGVAVQAIKVTDQRLQSVVTNQGEFSASSYIVATGGKSRPETGSSGDGFGWLRQLGHHVVEPTPTIVPLRVTDRWIMSLAGLTLENIKITFFVENHKQMALKGNILLTHFGLSGPLILNAARHVADLLDQGEVTALIDLFPELDLGALDAQLIATFDANKNRLLKNVLKLLTPPGTAAAVLALMPTLNPETKVHSLTKAERKQLGRHLKALPVHIAGLMGFDKAVVADGGVLLTEIDSQTMRSRLMNNVYVTGDLLHINRPSGGYSLQLCWTTGYVAGSHA